jgi:hypothetical protein
MLHHIKPTLVETILEYEILLKGNHIKRAKNMLMIWGGFGTTLF